MIEAAAPCSCDRATSFSKYSDYLNHCIQKRINSIARKIEYKYKKRIAELETLLYLEREKNQFDVEQPEIQTEKQLESPESKQKRRAARKLERQTRKLERRQREAEEFERIQFESSELERKQLEAIEQERKQRQARELDQLQLDTPEKERKIFEVRELEQIQHDAREIEGKQLGDTGKGQKQRELLEEREIEQMNSRINRLSTLKDGLISTVIQAKRNRADKKTIVSIENNIRDTKLVLADLKTRVWKWEKEREKRSIRSSKFSKVYS